MPSPNYAVFNNGQSRELIKSWAPKFVRSSEPGGSGLTPSSTENMQRFVMLSRLELWNLTPTRADSRTPPELPRPLSLSLSLVVGRQRLRITLAHSLHPRAFTPPARIHSTAVRRSRHTHVSELRPNWQRGRCLGALFLAPCRFAGQGSDPARGAEHRLHRIARRFALHHHLPLRGCVPTRISPRESAHAN